MIQSRNRFFLSCVTICAGIGLFTRFGTSSFFRHLTRIPIMLCGQTLMGIITLAVFIMGYSILGINPHAIVFMIQGRNFTGNFHSTLTAGCFLSAFRCTPRLCHNTPAIFGNITVVALLILNSYRSNAKIIDSSVTTVRKAILIDCHFNRDRTAKLLVPFKRSNFFQIVLTRFSDREGCNTIFIGRYSSRSCYSILFSTSLIAVQLELNSRKQVLSVVLLCHVNGDRVMRNRHSPANNRICSYKIATKFLVVKYWVT